MSAPERRVVLSPEAQSDYDDLLLAGLLRWGDTSTRRYQSAIDQALDLLSKYPELCERRDDLAGCRCDPVEHHLVYYRIAGDAIQVVRILHERAASARHLPR